MIFKARQASTCRSMYGGETKRYVAPTLFEEVSSRMSEKSIAEMKWQYVHLYCLVFLVCSFVLVITVTRARQHTHLEKWFLAVDLSNFGR